MSRSGWTRILTAALLALAVYGGSGASRASANAGDVVGFGSESIARGGAMAAVADGAEALHYNPAGLIAAERAELSVGYMRFLSTLSWTGVAGGVPETHSADISSPDSITIGLVVPLGRVALGAYISTLPTKLLGLRVQTTADPTFGYYANRTQRIVVLLGGAVDLGHGLSFGGGVSIFGGVDGLVLASEGPTRDVEPGIFIGADTALSGQLGLRYELNEHVRLGLTYRHRFRVPVKIQADSTVGNVPLNITFRLDGVQTPYELVAGGAVDVGIAQLSMDATWQRWRNLRAPWVSVDTIVTGLPIENPPIPRAYRDAFDLRLGAQIQQNLSEQWTLFYRAGGRFETSMGASQPGLTSMMDGNKLGIAAGLGVRFGNFYGLPVTADLHFSMDHMFSRTYVKDADSGSRFEQVSGGGQVMSLGFTLTVGLTQ
ncbi:MAG: hypothetical protein KC593_00520 [Myxococcales bacterium]|nr:hypothetical protein [Myxococcales bacterium]